MKLIIIAAVSTNGVIGANGNIPWHIPEDLKHYRETTMGNTLIVGVKTFNSLPPKALEGRNFIILNKRERLKIDEKHLQFKSVETILNLLDDVKTNDDNVYIIGGTSVYEEFIDYCDEAIITWVDKEIPNGDKFFPIPKLFDEFYANPNQEWETSANGESYIILNYVRK